MAGQTWVEEHFEGHLKLDALKEEPRARQHGYLFNIISPYPHPEFHVSHLKHDTGETGLDGIRKDGGFKDPKNGSNEPEGNSLVWWSLSVGDEDIALAEKRLLETRYPGRTEEQAQNQQSFLGDFATSPAFTDRSWFGMFRFTFPLEEVLKAYSEQFCCDDEPVMRVYETILYKQEVRYVVLVHSPANEERFSKYPRLDKVLVFEDPVVSYKNRRFIWRSQAMCSKHSYELVQMDDEQMMRSRPLPVVPPQYYVCDLVAIALHVEEQVLKFEPDKLRKNLSYCERVDDKPQPVRLPDAEKHVQKLWDDSPRPLPRAKALKTASNPAE